MNRQLLRWHSIKSTLRYLFGPGGEPAYVLVSLGLVTLFGLALRLLLINKPVQYDEAYTFIHYASKPLAVTLANYSAPNNHIFHTFLVSLTYRLLGGGLWTLRLPALLAGVLCVPAAYLAARRFFSRSQALAAAAVIAATPGLIEYSVNGRGYTLVVLFSLLLANFAGLLAGRQEKSALAAYAITAALGFYTIPIFLYPMAGISLWLAVTYLLENEPWQTRLKRLGVFLAACALAGLLAILLYSPVIFFGTGLASLVGNEIVEPQTWRVFLMNLSPRLANTAISWMMGVSPAIRVLLLVGFLLSLFFYRRVSNQAWPLQISLVVGSAVFMVLQRVVPLPRIWLFMEAFYMFFAAAGLVWALDWLIQKLLTARAREALLSAAILVVVTGVFVNTLFGLRVAIVKDRDLPEEHAAGYIVEHIQPGDVIFALPPVDIQTAYYLVLQDIPFDRFYQKDHPVPVRNALVLVRTNSKHNTLQKVLDAYGLASAFDLSAGAVVYEYGQLQVYSVTPK